MADDRYLTPGQVADELQVTVVTVRRWITTGQLPASKAGPRKWMVRRADLDAFLSGGSIGGHGDVAIDVTEDPSFRRYLVVPE
jgi:excisionase family DNA binding protein